MTPPGEVAAPSIHATCLLVGAAGVLIRGPSGAGKTRLALALIDRHEARHVFARLVADDRVHLANVHGRLVARVPPALAGLVERRGLGVVPIAHEAAAVVDLVVDIVADTDQERLPQPSERIVMPQGIGLPRLAVPGDPSLAVPLVLAALAQR